MKDSKLKLLIFTLTFLLVTFAFSQVNLPTWSIGNWYEIDQSLEADGSMQGGTFNLSVTSIGSMFQVTDIGTRQHQRGDMGTYNVYIMTYSGNFDATGHVSITDPVPFDADVRILGGTMSGEFWINVDDLSTVTRTRNISGTIEANIGGVWTPLGTVEITETEEYQPPMQETQFPINIGNSWNQDITIYAYGHIFADLNVFGIPYQIDQDFDESVGFGFNAQVTGVENVNNCDAYKTHISENNSNATEDYWYCEDACWMVKTSIQNLQFTPPEGGGINLNSFTMDVTDYNTNCGGGETPTPEPTQPPATPTPTPTTPPETPTPTPTTPPYTPTTPPETPYPTATPTAPPGEFTVDVIMPSDYYCPGMTCYLKVRIYNPGEKIDKADFFVVLDIGTGDYWFYPSWSHYPPNLDYEEISVDHGETMKDIIPEFTWPDVPGSFSGITFHSAVTDELIIKVYGYGFFTFGYGPCK